MRKLLVIISFFLCCSLFSQELNCSVEINAQATGRQNQQVFKTLKNTLMNFMNNTTWTDKVYADQERINCSLLLTINEFSGDSFSGTLLVQSSRPVFQSSYNSPILNINDKDLSFQYAEFQNFTFNKNQFDNNLISILAYYAYMIIGYDCDTFKLNGGDSCFKEAQNIVNVAQSSGLAGWNVRDRNSRSELITQVLSTSFKGFRNIMYYYHIKGIDLLSSNKKKAKETMLNGVKAFTKLNSRTSNSYVQRTFFDAKANEICGVFSGGPKVPVDELLDVLNKVSPNNSRLWKKINY